MAERPHIAPCRVYVDPKIPRGYVELPPEFFKTTTVRPGHHVVLRNKGLQVKERARQNEMLKECEIAVSPRLALYLGVDNAQLLDVHDRATVGDELFDEVVTFNSLLEESAERLEGRMSTDLKRFKGMTVQEVLDRLIANPNHPDRAYLVVPPNPPGFGIPRGEICEDPSLTEKEWHPDDGTGKVKVFHPEGDGANVEPDE